MHECADPLEFPKGNRLSAEIGVLKERQTSYRAAVAEDNATLLISCRLKYSCNRIRGSQLSSRPLSHEISLANFRSTVCVL